MAHPLATRDGERRASPGPPGQARPGWRERLLRWIERREWDEGTILMVAGAAIGVVSGLAVVGFYRLIDLCHHLFISWPGAQVPRAMQLAYWPLLTGAGLLAAWALVRHTRIPEGQNVPDVQLAVAKRDAVIPGRPIAVRTLASAITLGSGGSAGSEGPVAVLGSALGSFVARVLGVRARHRKMLVGCGAAAGIAAAFNAPFAGAFFALEEVLGSFSVGAFSPVVIASVAGSLAVIPFLGHHPAFHLPAMPASHPIATALLYPALGLACGAVSALYARAYLAAPRVMRRLPGPEWLRPLVGGLVVGGIVAASGGVLVGTGHLAIPSPVFGGMAWWALLLICAAKIVATVVTLAAGGSGGVFTPTLFIGAALGGGMGVALAPIVPGHLVHPHAWALVGMAGLVAGATRAPLTAIFMVFEMTGDWGYVVPLLIVTVVSLVTVRRLAPHGLYDGWLAQRGEHLAHGVDRAVMDRLHLGAAMERDVPTVPADAPLTTLIAAAAATRHTQVAVVGSRGELVGLVSHHEIREALLARGAIETLLVAEDLAIPVESLRPESSLRDALAVMNARGLDSIPVVDGDDASPQFIGLLTRAALLREYERALVHAV